MIDPEQFRSRKRTIDVLGTEMALIDEGEGSPTFVLLHGNPTSSFLWREVIGPLRPLGRCVAPDLIGMGDSARPADAGPDSFGLLEHRRYLDELLDEVLPEGELILVVHDWGSALGFDWARRHPDRVAGIAYMEAIVRPVDWEQWPEGAREIFQAFRSPAGEELILEKNLFVEAVLPSSILRELESAEHDEYRRPFAEPGESRRPTLRWPRELPIDGEPAEVVEIVEDYGAWLSESEVPKLFIDADPGAILVGPQREFCRGWPNQREARVPGAHFIQEDSGPEIGRLIADWAATLG
ncbi:MAG TPA: haloalkane dehalogenase [Solirubrobacterales bacterium]|nr:haloalkane dehalogenase [Solirubrobacterales bacterium]